MLRLRHHPVRPVHRLGRTIAAGLAMGLMAAALSPAAPASAWGVTVPVTIAPSGSSVSMGADNSGAAATAWVAGNRVWVSTKAAAGTAWSTPAPVSNDPVADPTVGTVTNADLDMSPAGHIAVAWTQTPPGSTDSTIWQTQRDPNGGFLAPRAVSAPGNLVADDFAQIDIGTAGMASVVWLGTSPDAATLGRPAVRAAQMTTAIAPTGFKTLAAEAPPVSYGDIRLARGGNGDIVAAWRWTNGTTSKIQTARKTGAGWSTTTSTAAIAGVVVDPAVTVDGIGRSWVAWSQGATAETAVPVFAAQGSLGTITALGTAPGRGLQIAANWDGQGAATWITGAGLQFADLRRNSTPVTAQTLAGGAVVSADVGYSDSGAATVAYVPAASTNLVVAHRPLGKTFTSTTVSGTANARPIVATRADNAVIVWGDSVGGAVQGSVLDTTTPAAVHVTSPLRPFNRGTTISAGWVGTDSASPLTYTVSVARAGLKSAFGPFTTWQTTTATSAPYVAAPGDTVCFQVSAVDAVGHPSTTSSVRCTAAPMDDRALTRKKLRGKRVWVAKKAGGHLDGTFIQTRTKGATVTLRGVRGTRIALLAPRKRGYGTVTVWLGKTKLGTVDLSQKRKGTAKQTILPIGGTFTARRGTVKIKVTSKKKLVRLDGLYVYGG